MKTCYLDKEHRAIADLVAPMEITPFWTITRINVPDIHRGKGLGSKLLKAILQDADQEQVTLALEVFSSGDLDYSDLVNWYGRYGFTVPRFGYLVRKPLRREQ
jgi:GNAT superfamily N-acetyltransferase